MQPSPRTKTNVRLAVIGQSKVGDAKFKTLLIFSSCNRQMSHSLAGVVKAPWSGIV